MATLICPNCRSTNLRRSRAHGLREGILKILRRKPFRCKDCGWRGLMFSSEGHDGSISKQKAYLFAALFSLIILLLLIIFNLRPEAIEKIARQLIGNSK